VTTARCAASKGAGRTLRDAAATAKRPSVKTPQNAVVMRSASDSLTRPPPLPPRGVAVQVEFASKTWKLVFHFIGSRVVETRRFQAMGQLD
jgi:hypothetical protein